MSITTVDQLAKAMRTSQPVLYSKASRGGSNSFNVGTSFWAQSGFPVAGGLPASTSTCNHLTSGALPFVQQQSPRKTYVAAMTGSVNAANDHFTTELHDRLIVTGSITGDLDTLQSLGGDLDSFLATDNIDARKGNSNYSEVMWTYESTAIHGATPATATIEVTYNDGSIGNLNSFTANGLDAAYMLALASLIPDADQGKYIRGVNSIIYSAVVGGSARIVASRYRASVTGEFFFQKARTNLWDNVALPEIHNSSCLYFRGVYNGTTTGDIRGTIHFVYG